MVADQQKSIILCLGFPGGSVVKNPPAMQDMQEMWVQLLGREDPLEQEMATHSNLLLGTSHGQSSLVGYSPWGHKESDRTEATKTNPLPISFPNGRQELHVKHIK